MARNCLLLAAFIMIFCACDIVRKAGLEPIEPSSEPAVPTSSPEPEVSSVSVSVPEPVSSEPEPVADPSSADEPGDVCANPDGQADAPVDAPPGPELVAIDENHGLIDGITFKYPAVDAAGVRHIAAYQNYASIVLTIPTSDADWLDIEALREMIETNEGVCVSYEELPDILLATLPSGGYNALLGSILTHIEDELTPRFEELSERGMITHFESFDIDEESCDAVFIYMSGNQIALLTDFEATFIAELASACNIYHELLGQGSNTKTPVRFVDSESGKEYSYLWFPTN